MLHTWLENNYTRYEHESFWNATRDPRDTKNRHFHSLATRIAMRRWGMQMGSCLLDICCSSCSVLPYHLKHRFRVRVKPFLLLDSTELSTVAAEESDSIRRWFRIDVTWQWSPPTFNRAQPRICSHHSQPRAVKEMKHPSVRARERVLVEFFDSFVLVTNEDTNVWQPDSSRAPEAPSLGHFKYPDDSRDVWLRSRSPADCFDPTQTLLCVQYRIAAKKTKLGRGTTRGS